MLSGHQTKKVKKILDKHLIPYKEINIKKHPWEECIAIGLHMHTGYTSFPNIYFGNEHVGGLDDLQSTFSIPGEMNKLLQRNEIPVEAGEYLQMDFSTS